MYEMHTTWYRLTSVDLGLYVFEYDLWLFMFVCFDNQPTKYGWVGGEGMKDDGAIALPETFNVTRPFGLRCSGLW